MVDQNAAPLYGLKWNEAEADVEFNRGLVTIVAHGRNGEPFAVGTGFIIKSEGRRAWALTAAHVLAEVRRLQSSEPRHNRTALDIFLPPVRAVDVDPKGLRAISRVGDNVEALIVEGLAFDERSDIAVLTLAPQSSYSNDIPPLEFAVDDKLPAVGSLVCVFSYGDLGTHDYERHGEMHSFKLSLRPILRVGRVLAHHLEGNRLCKGPCIETSIPVYSGMSGGAVLQYSEGDLPMRPFGLVCSDPDEDGPLKQDRSHEGSSIIALLPSHVEPLEGAAQRLTLIIPADQFGGTLIPSREA